jgi:hypothetical protein
MSGLLGIISAPFSMGTDLLGGLFGGDSGGGLGGIFSGLEGSLGNGLLTTLEPLILLFVGVEVFFKVIDKI